MPITLVEIPELTLPLNRMWQVRALVIDGKSPAISALLNWKRHRRADYNKIVKAIKLAAMTYRVADTKHVKKNSNPLHGEVFEFRAHTGVARLMFFYDEGDESLIVCTNWHEHGNSSNQDAAFGKCAAYKKLYTGSP